MSTLYVVQYQAAVDQDWQDFKDYDQFVEDKATLAIQAGQARAKFGSAVRLRVQEWKEREMVSGPADEGEDLLYIVDDADGLHGFAYMVDVVQHLFDLLEYQAGPAYGIHKYQLTHVTSLD